jgi:hypothetical protein
MAPKGLIRALRALLNPLKGLYKISRSSFLSSLCSCRQQIVAAILAQAVFPSLLEAWAIETVSSWMVADALCIPRRLENPNRFRSLVIPVGSGGVKGIADVGAITGLQDERLHEFLVLP